ncbi:MAG TPA: hypothetical protein VLA19_04085 [Herpetosiphonaceae bacterium]|nr:hypothetical protein [Herpetosiphonaceae bacterium]
MSTFTDTLHFCTRIAMKLPGQVMVVASQWATRTTVVLDMAIAPMQIEQEQRQLGVNTA